MAINNFTPSVPRVSLTGLLQLQNQGINNFVNAIKYYGDRKRGQKVLSDLAKKKKLSKEDIMSAYASGSFDGRSENRLNRIAQMQNREETMDKQFQNSKELEEERNRLALMRLEKQNQLFNARRNKRRSIRHTYKKKYIGTQKGNSFLENARKLAAIRIMTQKQLEDIKNENNKKRLLESVKATAAKSEAYNTGKKETKKYKPWNKKITVIKPGSVSY